MRMFYNLLLFTACLNFSAFLLPYFIALPYHTVFPWNPTDINSMFDFSNLASLAGIGIVSTAIGIVMLLMRQGTYALYALLIFAIGVLFKPINALVFAVPNLINALLPSSPGYTWIILGTTFNPIGAVVYAVYTFAIFMFLVELITQRNIT